MKLRIVIALACCAATLAADAPRSELWSLQPLTRPAIPRAPANFPQPRNPIDHFVWAGLQQAGLKPSPEADERTLTRRLSYLLTGLPPVLDNAINTDKLADRLIDSPHYGERWARHWLDVVRFAETHGFEMNQPRPSAWRFRDYVIRAFNEDKPYDQFVREQIAGDVFGADDATSFLVGGPWDQVKSPDPVLTANQRAEELHDMVSASSAAFLGLTVGCARCHDHKFDPIPQKDYYAMKAALAGVEHGERPRRDPEGLRLNARAAELRDRARELENILHEIQPLANPGSTNKTRLPVTARRNLELFKPICATKVRFTILKTSGSEPCLDELEIFSADGRNVALAANGAKATTSGVYNDPERHRLEHINDGRYGNSRSWISNDKGDRWIEIEFAEPVTITTIVWSRDREEKFRDRLPTEYLIQAAHHHGPWVTIASHSDRFAPGAEVTPWSDRSGKLIAERKSAVAEVGRIERDLATYAGRFQSKPEETHRLHRGDPMLKREPVQPGALSALPAHRWTDCRDTELTEDQSRRLALANWIANPANPLTARVMVNRIWHYHFGEGIVATPSDFGANGARPTHPELLDWLASEFIASGWSVKHIQRLIVSSATFRQTSAARPDGLAKDAGTRLLWRFPPRRLEAEAIRDSVLAASGALDLRFGGPGFSFFEPNDNYVRVYTPRADWPPDTFRRMVYGSIIRQRPDGVFGAFDCPDAGQIAPKRTSSTTPLQALNLLNSAFIVRQAALFAERLERERPANLDAQISRAFALAYQRAPAPDERAAAAELARSESVAILCRALLNANEFVYLF